jgi:hypothetical protein
MNQEMKRKVTKIKMEKNEIPNPTTQRYYCRRCPSWFADFDKLVEHLALVHYERYWQ